MKNILLLLALAGCAAPQPVFRPVEVDMPVAAACAAPSVAQPVFPHIDVTQGSSLFDKTRAVLLDLQSCRADLAAAQAQLTP